MDLIDICRKAESTDSTFWTGLTLRIPGDQERTLLFKILEDGTTSKTKFITTDNWKAQCYNDGKGEEGFLVTSPNGVKYYMTEWMFPSTDYHPNTDKFFDADERFYFTSWKAKRVVDLHGNNLTYYYDKVEYSDEKEPTWDEIQKNPVYQNPQWWKEYYFRKSMASTIVTAVTSNDGRYVDFNYRSKYYLWSQNFGSRLIISINVEGNIFNLEYAFSDTATHKKGELISVTRPGQKIWKYEYAAANQHSTSNIDRPENYGPSPGLPGIKKVTYPDGGVIEYKFSVRDMKELNNKSNYKYLALKKRYSSDEIDNAITYSYGESFDSFWSITYDVTNIEIDGINRKFSFVSFKSTSLLEFSQTRGKLSSEQVFDSHDNLVMSKVFHVVKQRKVGQSFSTLDDGSSQYQLPITYSQVVSDDGSMLYATEFNNFDVYGNAQQTIETTRYLAYGSMYYSKRTDYSYNNDINNWVIGKVKNIEFYNRFSQNPNPEISYLYCDIAKHSDCKPGDVKSTTKFGKTTTYSYTGNGDIATITDPNGNKTTYKNYKRGLPTEISQTIDGATVTTYQTISNDGTIESITDAEGNKTTYSYNGIGQVTNIDYPLGADVKTIYGTDAALGTITTKFNKDSTETLYGVKKVDGFGRIISDKVGENEVAYTYDSVYDRITNVSLPRKSGQSSASYTYEYDELGRLSKITNSADASTKSFQYFRDQVTVTDEASNQTVYHYRTYGTPNDYSQLVKIVTPENIVQDIQYNVVGNVTLIRNGETERSFIYDDHQQLWKETHPETGTTVYLRDNNGNVTSKTIGSNQAIHYEYDEANRLTKKYVTGKDLTVDYIYDKVGNLTSVSNSNSTISYDYDANYNLLGEIIDIGEKTFKLTHGYNDFHYLTSSTYPSGEVIDFVPDSWGRSTKVGRFAGGVNWYPNGMLKSVSLGNGLSLDVQLNNRQSIDSISYGDNISDVMSVSYKYDTRGNVEKIDSIIEGMQQTLTYDKDNRLNTSETRWVNKGTYYKDDLSYDNLGNIASFVKDTLNSTTHSLISRVSLGYNYDQLNNLLKSITGNSRYNQIAYDSLGNIASDSQYQYSFDNYSRLTTAYKPQFVAYDYDGNNNLIYKNPGQDKEVFSYYGANGKKFVEYFPESSSLQDDKLVEFYYLNNHLVASKTLTEMHLLDTDGDTINDAYELVHGLDMNQAYLTGADKDSDGLNDLKEFQVGTSASSSDTDNDGLTDYDEVVVYQTNPLLEDSDGDGTNDNLEIANGSNPNVDEAKMAALIAITSLLLN